tara:strand:+ start:3471 stop:4310 length:840 start_codon:yes stop_codon:yes gene_type:complete
MILIDYNGIAISNVVAMGLEIEEDMIRHMILNSIRMHRVKHKEKCGEIVICCDGSKNWRKDYFPQYKHKRKSARKDSKLDWNELFRITNLVLSEIKENFPWKVIDVDECEADDVIGELVRGTQEFGQYENVMIISGDKDFAQLQAYGNVAQYSPVQRKFIKEDNPKLQLFNLIVKGDTSDGVPNILSGDNCFVDGVRQTPLRQTKIDMFMQDPLSLGEEVLRNYKRNKKLIDLSDTPKDIKIKIADQYANYVLPRQNVMNYLVEKRCRLLLEDIPAFIG